MNPLPRARRRTRRPPVRDQLIDGLLHGDRVIWAGVGVLWVLAAILVLVHRAPPYDAPTRRAGAGFAFALLAVTTATSLVGLPLATALAIPRIQWRAADTPELLAPNGSTTWRRLRGPAVALKGPEPDIGVPTIDASNRWILVGLISGKPVPGLAPAEASDAAPGDARLCSAEGAACRAWPVSWPDPARPSALGEIVWSRVKPRAPERPLAFDVETGLYLVRIDPAPGVGAGLGGPHLEIIGRAGAEPKVEGPQVVFLARSVAGGRLRAARIAAMPDPAKPGAFAFHLHRATASLTAGPRALAWVARPILMLTAFALPLGLGAYLLARRRGALERALPRVESLAALAAGLAVAAPAIVAVASLWGAR